MAPARTLTLTEREGRRQKLRDYAMAHALDNHLTGRCRWAIEGGIDAKDHGCTGRSGFCLCTCHDSGNHG